jgi:hypothetical protein
VPCPYSSFTAIPVAIDAAIAKPRPGRRDGASVTPVLRYGPSTSEERFVNWVEAKVEVNDVRQLAEQSDVAHVVAEDAQLLEPRDVCERRELGRLGRSQL